MICFRFHFASSSVRHPHHTFQQRSSISSSDDDGDDPMPALKVEYAKTGRSKCTSPECKKFIAQGELRMGTGTMMPGATELSYSWRHIPCFSKRQVANCGSSVDNVEGFDDLLPEHQTLMHKMLKGEFAGNLSLIGKIVNKKMADEAAAKAAVAEQRAAKKADKDKAGRRRERAEKSGDGADLSSEEDVNDVYMRPTPKPGQPQLAAASQHQQQPGPARPKQPCPYGAACFKVGREHFDEYSHPGDDALDAAPVAPAARAAAPPAAASKAVKARATTVVSVAAFADVKPAEAASEDRARPGHCKFGQMCFRTDPEHFTRMTH